MEIEAEKIIALTEVNKNLSKVIKEVDDKGAVIITKNESNVIEVAQNVLNENLEAFRELAK